MMWAGFIVKQKDQKMIVYVGENEEWKDSTNASLS